VSENLLAAQKAASGGVNGVFAPNESTTFGMLLALKKAGLAGKIRFIGFDASDKLVQGVRDGDQIHRPVRNNPAVDYNAHASLAPCSQRSHRRVHKAKLTREGTHKLSLCGDASSRFAPNAHRRGIETDERLFIVVTTTIKNIHRPQYGRAFTPRVCNYEIDPLAQWRSFAEQSTSEVIACSRGKDRQGRVRIDSCRMDIEIGVKFEKPFCRLTEGAVAADDTNALRARPQRLTRSDRGVTG